MNKAELIGVMASQAGISKNQAGNALDAMLDAITDALKANDKVTLVNFGTFHVSERAARQGRNPRTGTQIQIPGKTVARFKPGKALGEALN